MTTFVPLIINNQNSPPFQSQFTLDGTGYTGAVTWNFGGQRWYFTLYDQSGNLITNQPLIGSPTNANNYLLPGLFQNSTLLYRSDTGNFEVNP